MSSTKPILASRTVWANIVGFLALLASLLGYRVAEVDANHIADALAQLVAAASFIVSTLFRVAATKSLAPPTAA